MSIVQWNMFFASQALIHCYFSSSEIAKNPGIVPCQFSNSMYHRFNDLKDGPDHKSQHNNP